MILPLQAREKLRETVRREIYEQTFDAVDTNGDGVVDRQEYLVQPCFEHNFLLGFTKVAWAESCVSGAGRHPACRSQHHAGRHAAARGSAGESLA